jgi:hypothetical protein
MPRRVKTFEVLTNGFERDPWDERFLLLEEKINEWALRNSAKIVSASIAPFKYESGTVYPVAIVVYEEWDGR